MIDHGKFNLLGVQISAVDYDAAVAKIIEAAKLQRPFAVSALAVHGVMTGVMDLQHRYRLNHLDLIVPDGQPVRWGLNFLYRLKLPDRVYGPNLTLKVCQAAAESDLPIFLFGSRAETLDKLHANLLQKYPRLQIVGKEPSQFRRLTAEQRDQLVERIKNSGARIAMVGIGCPRQEVWAYEFRERLSMPLLAVGAAFSFHAGELKQAYPWMQRVGLEWLYRLGKEPLRLWKRYVFLNPAYVTLLGLQALRIKSLKPDHGQKPTEEILYG